MAIDITIPRECVYRTFGKKPGPCPRCGSSLKSRPATYLVATRRGTEITDSFIIGGDLGWFCPKCPTVVIDPNVVNEFLWHARSNQDVGDEFIVLGIVDLDAIPADKAHLPLGHEDVPLELIEFTKVTYEGGGAEQRAPLQGSKPSLVSARQGGSFEERYEDVLQNIEFGIVRVYREHPQMSDWQALAAIEALLRAYQAEVKGRPPRHVALDALSEKVYIAVRVMCEWRLGRETFYDDDGPPVDFEPEPITVKEMIDCLKRVRKSINLWTRRSGRQGYLTFVQQYIP